MLVKLNGPIPAFVNVTGSEALDVPTFCGVNASEVGEILGVCGCPAPLRATVWAGRGYVPEWATTLSVATGEVVTPFGVNVTLIVQLPPAGRPTGRFPHVFVCLKFMGFVPTIVMLIVSGAIPLLDTVICCAALIVPNCCGPNVSDFVEKVREMPLPLSDTVTVGCVGSFVVMVTLAIRGPGAVGLNRTVTAHCWPAARTTGTVLQEVGVAGKIRKSPIAPE